MELNEEERSKILKEFSEIANLPQNECEFYLNAANFDLMDALNIYYENHKNNSNQDKNNIVKKNDEIDVNKSHDNINKNISNDKYNDREKNDDELYAHNFYVPVKGQTDDKVEFHSVSIVPNNHKQNTNINSQQNSNKNINDNVNKGFGTRNIEGNSAQTPSKKKRIFTMEDIMKSDSSDDHSDDAQKFFAGGGAPGGGHTQIIGNPDRKNDGKIDAQNVFERAKQAGAKVVADGDDAMTNPAFRSRGMTLEGKEVGNTDDTQMTKIELFSNGFLLDDEYFFDISDPKTSQYLNDMTSGYVPVELHRLFKNKTSKPLVALTDNSKIKYQADKQSTFSKNFKILGTPTPTVVYNQSSARSEIVANNSETTSHIQYRLNDGTRYSKNLFRRSVTVNPHIHTVRDLYNHVRWYYFFNISQTPQGNNFTLMINFPSTPITEDDTLIENTNLSKNLILQRFI